MRVLVAAALLVGCSDAPASRDAAPDARFCIPNSANCLPFAQPFEGTWVLTGTHVVYRGPGPGFGNLSIRLTFTPTADEGCYDGVASGVPSTAGANWPDPNGAWRTDGAAASFDTVRDGSLPVSWSFCTRPSDGIVQFQGTSRYSIMEAVESFTGTAAKQ